MLKNENAYQFQGTKMADVMISKGSIMKAN